MPKIAERYLNVNPWLIVEEGFHSNKGRVSESIFSLANEFMGVRGYFDEGYSGNKLIGSYINGLYEEKEIIHAALFKGFSTRFCFMVNTVDWLYTRITVDGETLDLAKSEISGYSRCLDMKKGTLTREFTWEHPKGKRLHLKFLRFTSMVTPNLGCQRISFKALNFSGVVTVESGLDFSIEHELEGRNLWKCIKAREEESVCAIHGMTEHSGQQLFSSFTVNVDTNFTLTKVEMEKYIGKKLEIELVEGNETHMDKMVVNHAVRKKGEDSEKVWQQGMALSVELTCVNFDEALCLHEGYWEDVWSKLDITIEGDPENQQGVRFCIFNLHQTYHGQDSTLNIGAKGLTGECYFGWTWWDTETYCLPFYIFNNPAAAKSLLEYRYNTLPQALERAIEMDCSGACYPMGTIDGTESCGTWQHGNLEIHVSAAIPYGIWHFMKVCKDKEFLYEKGIEILLQVSRYFASRGDWSQKTNEYGFYGVMGADEFHMMVHNNTYTNVMAKKVFQFTLETVEEMKTAAPGKLFTALEKTRVNNMELQDWKLKSEKIRINYDEKLKIFEQHDGYFDLPHTDVKAIPHTEFPVYKHWAYDRIFRTDMIKQPDVLLLLLFFSNDYSMDIKRANYEYYEPRCSHESSLSPSIHSIMAMELGKYDEAHNFSYYASRLDLDNYNRNTEEGLHITSMAGTWMNMIYGFGGMRSDANTLVLNPSIPDSWNSYSFRILYQGVVISVEVNHEQVIFKTVSGPAVRIRIYGKLYNITEIGTSLPLKTK